MAYTETSLSSRVGTAKKCTQNCAAIVFFDVLMKRRSPSSLLKLINVSATGSEEAVVFEGYFPDYQCLSLTRIQQ